MIDHPDARAMMNESEVVLKPILEKYKHLADPKVWQQYQDGEVAGWELLEHNFYRCNP